MKEIRYGAPPFGRRSRERLVARMMKSGRPRGNTVEVCQEAMNQSRGSLDTARDQLSAAPA